MVKISSLTSMLALAGLAAALVGSAGADSRKREEVVRAWLVGYSEVPSVSTSARGSFRAVIDERAGTIVYKLSYEGLVPSQSHLHLGQHHTNGGIMVFLCTNLGNGPAGTQACPAAPAEITGMIMAANVTGGPVPNTTPPQFAGIPAQGIAPGDFSELLAAIRHGAVYVNVHSPTFGPGEIRGQLQ